MNIGITGGFLGGKTSFALMLAKEMRYEFWSSDTYVHELYKNKKIRKIIIDNFGESVYKGEDLQNKVLSDLVFNSEENLRILESIIHPQVEIEIRKRAGDNQKNTIFEIPLLYEKNLQGLMDVCVLVVSNSQVCIERAKNRGFSREDYFLRTRFQMTENQKLLNNPLVARNDGSLEDLKKEVKRIAGIIIE
jgi:dephospho-CoA kinase